MRNQNINKSGTGLAQTISEENIMTPKRNSFIIVMALCLSIVQLLSNSSAFAGGVSTGGGDVESERIIDLVKKLEVTPNGDSPLKEILTNIINYTVVLKPDSAAAEQIINLEQKGLVEDIQKSRYVLKKNCRDETGTEKSASTQKINLIENPNQAHPDICLNVRKLAQENASEKEILGLLMHEHARHFGQEDTDDLGVHPLALGTMALNASFENNLFGFTGYTGDDRENRIINPDFLLKVMHYHGEIRILTKEKSEKFEVIVKNIQGPCTTGYMAIGEDERGRPIDPKPLDFKPGAENRRQLFHAGVLIKASVGSQAFSVFGNDTSTKVCTATFEINYENKLVYSDDFYLDYRRVGVSFYQLDDRSILKCKLEVEGHEPFVGLEFLNSNEPKSENSAKAQCEKWAASQTFLDEKNHKYNPCKKVGQYCTSASRAEEDAFRKAMKSKSTY